MSKLRYTKTRSTNDELRPRSKGRAPEGSAGGAVTWGDVAC